MRELSFSVAVSPSKWVVMKSACGPTPRGLESVSPDLKRGPPVLRIFGIAAVEYFRKYGGGVTHLAKIGEFQFLVQRMMCVVRLAAKNHKHSVEIPYSQFWVGHSKAAVLASP
ncbi:hypothetical protein EDB89DRAFT_1962568 [Lactarius sanguifluus]|nr:hypothetical protein EDB89DRAFT_1962568 [Lactarius sanguifluus]